MKDSYWVYIMASHSRKLYVGVTSDLVRRVYQHKQGVGDGFARRYSMTRLVYFEQLRDPRSAIVREKQLKGCGRKRKVRLIEGLNPKWLDLSAEWFDSTGPSAKG